MSTTTRGPDLPKSGDRSRSRRKRKAVSGTGSSGVPSTPLTSPALFPHLCRLAYAVRKSRDSSVSRVVRRALGRLFPSKKRSSACFDLPPSKHKSRFPFARDLRKKPVNFVPATTLYTPPVPTPVRNFREWSPVILRCKSIRNIGYDPRTFNTFLEAPDCLRLRRAQWALRRGQRTSKLSAEEEQFYHYHPIFSKPSFVPAVHRRSYIEIEDGFRLLPPDPFKGSVFTLVPALALDDYSWPRAAISEIKVRDAVAAFERLSNSNPAITPEMARRVAEDDWNQAAMRYDNLTRWKPVERDPDLVAAGWYGPESMEF